MCLILFAYKAVPGVSLIVAANRDEWFLRPAKPAGFWDDDSRVLAGRDIQAGGTWLGITTGGRFSALTNFRNPSDKRDDAPSRGDLVRSFLTGKDSPRSYLECLSKHAASYNGFSLLTGDTSRLYCYSNQDPRLIEVMPGVHGLSNHLLDTPWPKVVKGCAGLKALLDKPFRVGAYLDLMDDSVPVQEQAMPGSDANPEWERSLSSMRIMKGNYGTRCSTVLRVMNNGETEFSERTYDIKGDIAGEVNYRFRLSHGQSRDKLISSPRAESRLPEKSRRIR